MNERIFSAVRGAVQIPEDSEQAMIAGVGELYRELTARNLLASEDIVSIIISQTPDLNVMNAATALRIGSGVDQVPLFCVQECQAGSFMPRVVRFLIHGRFLEGSSPAAVYINGAEKLRPDKIRS